MLHMPQQTAEDLNSIKDAAYRLLELVNDLLDLSKLEAGRMELCLEVFSVSDLFQEMAAKWGLEGCCQWQPAPS